MNPTELALIANLLGGISEASAELGVDEILLQDAINNEELTRQEQTDILSAVNEYEKYVGFDVDDFNEKLADLQLTEQFIYDAENILEFRNLIADKTVPLDNLPAMQNAFANLNPTYIDAVIDFIGEGGDYTPFIDLFESEEDFWNLDNAEFWEWFREVFYNE